MRTYLGDEYEKRPSSPHAHSMANSPTSRHVGQYIVRGGHPRMRRFRPRKQRPEWSNGGVPHVTDGAGPCTMEA